MKFGSLEKRAVAVNILLIIAVIAAAIYWVIVPRSTGQPTVPDYSYPDQYLNQQLGLTGLQKQLEIQQYEQRLEMWREMNHFP